MNDPIKFLQRLSIAGGSIVSTGSLTSAEIATAFNDGRMFVDQDHLGYVFCPESSCAPEGATLIAVGDSEGWLLQVEDPNDKGEAIAYLAWPESWPKEVGHDFLIAAGFKIVPA